MKGGGIRVLGKVADPRVVEAFKRITSLPAVPASEQAGGVSRSEAARVIWSGTARGIERFFKPNTQGTGKPIKGDTVRVRALAAAVSGEITDDKGRLLAAVLEESLG